MASRWLILLLALGATAPPAGWAQSSQGEVLSIGDGDTIRVRQAGQAVTVRLACIDAPETAQSPWGQQARRYLQQRLPIGSEVMLEIKSTDRYGRLVAEVISDINIGLAMVEDGQAFAYRQYLGGCDAREYLDAEFRASRHRYGVWQEEGGITRPWDFRRSRSGAVIPDGTTPRPGIAATGPHLSRQQRRWGGLRVTAALMAEAHDAAYLDRAALGHHEDHQPLRRQHRSIPALH